MRFIPVDVSNLTFVCVALPRPKLVDQESGEVKTDKDGRTVFQVGLSAADALGRVDLLNVAVCGDPGLTLGQIVVPCGLVGSPWDREDNGRFRSGVSYRAEKIVPVVVPEPTAARSSGKAS